MLCEWYCYGFPIRRAFSAKFLHSVDHLSWCALSCFGTQQKKGVKWASLSLNALWVVLLGFPTQAHFSAKFLNSVDQLSCYVFPDALGNNNIKVWKEHPPHWMPLEWHCCDFPIRFISMQNFCTVLTTYPIMYPQLPLDTTIQRWERKHWSGWRVVLVLPENEQL